MPDDFTMNDARDTLRAMKANTEAFVDKQKARFSEFSERLGEQQARLSEVEQKLARRGDGEHVGECHGAGETVGALVLKSPQLDALRSGELRTLRLALGAFPRASLTSESYPGTALRDGEIYGTLARRLRVQDLIPMRTTTVGIVEFVRTTRTGNAGPQLDEENSPVVRDGAVKAAIDLAAELAQSPVITVAGHTTISRQVLADNVGLPDHVNNELLNTVDEATEDEILNGSGATGHMSGLMTEANTYNRAAGGDTQADTLRRSITQIQLARGVATGVVINPEDAEALELLKDDQHRFLMAFEVTDGNGRTVIWRVPTVITDAITAGTFLVGDFSRAARLYDRQQAMVSISLEHSDYFTRNLALVLAERRLALTVPRPTLLVKGTFPADSP